MAVKFINLLFLFNICIVFDCDTWMLIKTPFDFNKSRKHQILCQPCPASPFFTLSQNLLFIIISLSDIDLTKESEIKFAAPISSHPTSNLNVGWSLYEKKVIWWILGSLADTTNISLQSIILRYDFESLWDTLNNKYILSTTSSKVNSIILKSMLCLILHKFIIKAFFLCKKILSSIILSFQNCISYFSSKSTLNHLFYTMKIAVNLSPVVGVAI